MTEYVILKLSNLIKDLGEDSLHRIFDDYVSTQESTVNDFLSKSSIAMEKRGQCRTYLAFDKVTFKLIGFFAVGVKCLMIPDDCGLSKSTLKKLNRSEHNIAQAYLLGQLSRSKGYKGFGRTLIDEAIKKIREAYDLVGCRLIRLDCGAELVSYYKDYGFHFVKQNQEKDLNQMIMVIADP